MRASRTSVRAIAPKLRYFRSIGTRLALATAMLVLVVAGALYYSLTRYEREGQLQAKREAAIMVARLFAELASAPVLFGDDEGVRDSIGHLRSNEDVLEAAVFALRPDGKLEEDNALARFERSPGQRAKLGPPSADAVGAVQQSPEMLDVSQWVRDPSGTRLAAVLVRFSLARENQSYELLAQRTLQISVGVACLLTLLLLLLARIYIIAPLRSVHAVVSELTTTQQLRAADLRGRRRLPLAARDEIGDLARGFMKMAEAIERREAAIEHQNREMRLVLASVGEGFLVLDAHGAIEGQHSAVLESWFGPVPRGHKIWHYLKRHDSEQAEWLELTWANIAEAHMPIGLCLEQLPKTVSAVDRSYAVEYRPVFDDAGEKLAKMVVVISDITELRRREQAESEQRELVEVFGALVRDRTGFVSFCEDAGVLFHNMAEPPVAGSYQLLEHLHTIKGNAYLFRLRELAEACERVEAKYAESKQLPGREEAALLSQTFARSIGPVESFIALDRGQTVQMSGRDYASLVDALQTGARSETVLACLARASAEPVELVFHRFSERLQVLARRLGKCRVDVHCEGHNVRFPRQTFAPLWSVVVHVLRNIADHGLETAWERERAGKPLTAAVLLRAQVDGAQLRIAFQDDGRGVDWEKVRCRAESLGLPASTRSALTEALLGHGFTTREESGALSGRGVGLSAVVSEVKALGGVVQLESETGQGTTLTIELPSSLLVA